MKVLCLLQSARFSGAENVVCQIISALKSKSDIEMVYCSPDGQIREALNERDIQFEPIEKLSAREVKRVIKKFNPDIIHAHDRSACVMAAMASKKIPVIAHIHVNNNSGMASLLKNVIWTLFANKYRHIFWVSDSAYDEFQFKSVIKRKSSVLYNVIDIEALSQKAESDAAEYNYDIVYVGRLTYQKNPERLMTVLHNVIKKKPDVKVAIAGNGEYEQFVANYIKDNNLNDNIDYLGYTNNPLKIIKSSKVLIMTSRFEGTPMVALEAQCLGVPIVSTPVDGMKKVVQNGENGYLTDDDDEIVSRLTDIISDENTHSVLSENSLQQAMRYNDMDKYCDAITKAYYRK